MSTMSTLLKPTKRINNDEHKICRFCLKTCNGNYESIPDNTKEFTEVLLVYMDFDIIEDCVSCKKCLEMLQKCFEFKSICVHIEDKLVSESRELNRTNMTETYLQDMNKNNSDLFVIDKICRFCMKPVTHFLALTDITDEYFSDMLQKFLPEVKLNVTNNPGSCNNCLDFLKHYFTFLKRLHDVEEHIKEYCEAKSKIIRGKVELNNVVQHILNKISPDYVDKEAVLNREQLIETYFSRLTFAKECISKDQRKIRNLPIEKINEDIVDTKNYYLESSMKEDSDQNYIKIEEIEIKTEETIDSDVERDEENPNHMQGSSSKFKTSVTPHKGMHFFACHRCSYKTRYEDSLKKHLVLYGDSTICECRQCKTVFCSRRSFENHFLKKHFAFCDISPTFHSCKVCSYRTTIKSDLFNHINAKHLHYGRNQCNYCLCIFGQKSDLKRHISSVHLNLKPYNCEECKKTFGRKEVLHRHIVSHHPTNEGLMKTVTCTVHNCDYCSYKSANIRNMRKHREAHNKPLKP